MKLSTLRHFTPMLALVFLAGGCDKAEKKPDKPASTAAAKGAAADNSAEAGDPKPGMVKPIEVFAQKIAKTDIFEPIVFAGYIESEQRYAVTAETSGVLESIKVLAGDRVSKGQTLAVVKPASQGLTYNALTISSPLSGVVTEISATAGFPVPQGQAIMMVERDNALVVLVSVPAQDMIHAQTGRVVDVAVGDKSTTGKVVSVNSRADRVTGTFPARIKIDCRSSCADYPLGSLARVTIRSNERQGFKIPLTWLQQQRKKVLIITPEHKAHWVDVKLGTYLGENVEITEGLTDGMNVVSGFSDRPEEGVDLVQTAREEATMSRSAAEKPKG